MERPIINHIYNPNSTTIPTITTPTKPPPPCVNEWIENQYCEDENNIPECDFDGGDCCQQNPQPDWDEYCQVKFITVKSRNSGPQNSGKPRNSEQILAPKLLFSKKQSK